MYITAEQFVRLVYELFERYPEYRQDSEAMAQIVLAEFDRQGITGVCPPPGTDTLIAECLPPAPPPSLPGPNDYEGPVISRESPGLTPYPGPDLRGQIVEDLETLRHGTFAPMAYLFSYLVLELDSHYSVLVGRAIDQAATVVIGSRRATARAYNRAVSSNSGTPRNNAQQSGENFTRAQELAAEGAPLSLVRTPPAQSGRPYPVPVPPPVRPLSTIPRRGSPKGGLPPATEIRRLSGPGWKHEYACHFRKSLRLGFLKKKGRA